MSDKELRYVRYAALALTALGFTWMIYRDLRPPRPLNIFGVDAANLELRQQVERLSLEKELQELTDE